MTTLLGTDDLVVVIVHGGSLLVEEDGDVVVVRGEGHDCVLDGDSSSTETVVEA